MQLSSANPNPLIPLAQANVNPSSYCASGSALAARSAPAAIVGRVAEGLTSVAALKLSLLTASAFGVKMRLLVIGHAGRSHIVEVRLNHGVG